MEVNIVERALTFKYSFERKSEKDKLKEVLKENNIEYICYESKGYYSHEFVVRKSGRKWNDIYYIINSVMAVKYSFKNTRFEYIDNSLKEIVCVYNGG